MMLRKIFYTALNKAQRQLQAALGASTIGVRILVTNDKEEVLLVKHTYTDGWHFPGGGVNDGETIYEAAKRELMEETGVVAIGTLSLFDVYHHKIYGVNDYPLLLTVDQVEFADTYKPSLEIKEVKWFNLNKLPEDITKSTLNRIQEFINPLHIKNQNAKW